MQVNQTCYILTQNFNMDSPTENSRRSEESRTKRNRQMREKKKAKKLQHTEEKRQKVLEAEMLIRKWLILEKR